MRPPPFLKVLPAEIGRVGALGACILALVRYMTGLPGEANGRRVVEGETWWRAPAPDIAEALGGGRVSPRTVSSSVLELVGTGDLLAIPTQDFFGDRAKAYRASDQPSAEADTGSDQPSAEIADRIGRNGRARRQSLPTTSAESADLPIPGELEEPSGGENARAAEDETFDVEPVPEHGNAPPSPDCSAEEPRQPLDVTQRVDVSVDAIVGEVVDDVPDPEPQPYCDRHMPNGTDDNCGACGRRRQARETWQQRQTASALNRISSSPTEPRHTARRPPAPRREPPQWIPGPHGPRCRAHGHHEVAPVDCARCRDAAVAAGESA